MRKRGKHHSRCCHEAEPSIKWLESLSCVNKILLGRSESCRHSYTPGAIRYCSDTLGGINIKVYGGCGIIDGYVQSTETVDLIKKIKERFPT